MDRKRRLEFLPVCSDETVTDAAVSSTADLGFPVTTDPQDIATFLRRRARSRRVVFATYQSSPKIAEAYRLGRVPGFDLVIADEAHRCAGRVSSEFATVLDGDPIVARRRLFMTATPRFFTGRVVREAKEAEFEVASMDNESRFGPVFHRLGFAEAIARELLTDYQVAVVGVTDATYLDWAQRGRFVTIHGTKITDARTLAGQIVSSRPTPASAWHSPVGAEPKRQCRFPPPQRSGRCSTRPRGRSGRSWHCARSLGSESARGLDYRWATSTSFGAP